MDRKAEGGSLFGALSPDGERLAAGDEEGIIKIWSMRERSRKRNPVDRKPAIVQGRFNRKRP
jgi:hypothetical protein